MTMPAFTASATEMSLLDRLVATLGPSGAREHLRAMPLQAFVPMRLAEPWASMPAWDAGPSRIPEIVLRPKQIAAMTAPARYRVVSIRSGRSWGKNYCAATTVNRWAMLAALAVERGELRPSEARILLMGRSSEDARDSMILGPSGIVATSPPWFPATHEPGRRRVTWAGGLVEAIAFSAAEPDGPRGQNAIAAWADEACSWGPHLATAWSNLDLAVRTGAAPRILCTSTPRALPWLRELLRRPDVLDVHGATSENTALAADVVRGFFSRYAGAVAAQELRGEVVDIGEASWFPRGDAQVIDAAPSDITARVRAWDLAATRVSDASPDPDWTVGALLGRRGDGRIVVLHVALLRDGPGAVEDLIARTAEMDGRDVPIVLPQDPGAAGKSALSALARRLAGHVVHSERPTGTKESRAQAFSAQWQHGNVAVVRGSWNGEFLDQLQGFPSGYTHDDAIDAAASGFNHLAQVGAATSMYDEKVIAGLARLAGVSPSRSEGPPAPAPADVDFSQPVSNATLDEILRRQREEREEREKADAGQGLAALTGKVHWT